MLWEEKDLIVCSCLNDERIETTLTLLTTVSGFIFLSFTHPCHRHSALALACKGTGEIGPIVKQSAGDCPEGR